MGIKGNLPREVLKFLSLEISDLLKDCTDMFFKVAVGKISKSKERMKQIKKQSHYSLQENLTVEWENNQYILMLLDE